MTTNLSLPADVKVEEEKDVLGGSGILESGLYKGLIEMAYLDTNDKGTNFIVVHFKRGNVVHKFTTYISTKRQNPDDPDSVLFTYTDKQSGVQKPLPGYSLMNSFFKSVTGKDITAQTQESKKVKVYNYTSKKEEPKDVMVFTDVINQQASAGILKISQEKTTPESNYQQGTGEFRESNEFDKFFDPNTNQTMSEKAAGKDASFLLKWKEKNDNKTRIKKAPKPGNANTGAQTGAPNATAPGPDPFA